MRRDVQALITEGVQLAWDSYKLDPYVQRLAEMVFLFHERVDDLVAIEEQIDFEVKSLDTCVYSRATFTEVLSRIQKHVDDLSLHQYSNLLQWVARLDQEVTFLLLLLQSSSDCFSLYNVVHCSKMYCCITSRLGFL